MELRERILQKGLPCAVSFSPFDTSYLPYAHCVLTFRSAYSTVRAYLHSDRFSHLPILVIPEEKPDMAYLSTDTPDGKPAGKALPLVQALVPFMTPAIQQGNGVTGFFLANGFVVTPLQIYFRVSSLDLTEPEKRVLQFFLFHPDSAHPCRRIAACALPEGSTRVTEKVRTLVTGINLKTEQIIGMRLLHGGENKRQEGYFFRMPT